MSALRAEQAADQHLPDGVAPAGAVTMEELALAARNHGMPLEAMRYQLTPLGLHYLLIHFDIPYVDADAWSLTLDGSVDTPLKLTLDDLRARPAVTEAVTLECAGNGRALQAPRPLSQPWLHEAVGNAAWTGTPLRPLLEEAGIRDSAVEVCFTGQDRGIQGGTEQDYQRSLPLDEALRPETLLVYEVNGQPLPPQHGFPVRLICPGWYGMTQVKWLRQISVLDEPFDGYQQADSYLYKTSEDDPGVRVTKMAPRALMIPPGIPEFMSRERHVAVGSHRLQGRAWSGWAPVVNVEVSVDDGRSWQPAQLDQPLGPHAWRGWSYSWDAKEPGEYVLCCRASDESGNVQPLDQPWNLQGMSNNGVQRVPVVVR